jgi:hypothetical protein
VRSDRSLVHLHHPMVQSWNTSSGPRYIVFTPEPIITINKNYIVIMVCGCTNRFPSRSKNHLWLLRFRSFRWSHLCRFELGEYDRHPCTDSSILRCIHRDSVQRRRSSGMESEVCQRRVGSNKLSHVLVSAGRLRLSSGSHRQYGRASIFDLSIQPDRRYAGSKCPPARSLVATRDLCFATGPCVRHHIEPCVLHELSGGDRTNPEVLDVFGDTHGPELYFRTKPASNEL